MEGFEQPQDVPGTVTTTITTTKVTETATDPLSTDTDEGIYEYLLYSASAFGMILILIASIMIGYDVITQQWVLGAWTTDIIYLIFLAMFAITIVPRAFDSYCRGVIVADWGLLLIIVVGWAVILAVWIAQIAVFVSSTQYVMSGFMPGDIPEPPYQSNYSSSRRTTYGFVFALETVNILMGFICFGLFVSTPSRYPAAYLSSLERQKHRMLYDPIVWSQDLWEMKAEAGQYGETIQNQVIESKRKRRLEKLTSVSTTSSAATTNADVMLKMAQIKNAELQRQLFQQAGLKQQQQQQQIQKQTMSTLSRPQAKDKPAGSNGTNESAKSIGDPLEEFYQN
jgi:hypothetical protein